MEEGRRPGHKHHGEQGRTFRLELLRSVPQGMMATAFATFAIFVAIRVYDLPAWMKGMLLGASSIGLLLSLFVVQLTRRIGWPVNRVAATLWSGASCGFALAAFAGNSGTWYFAGVCAAFLSLGAGMPLMSQIYQQHYADENRGRLFALSSLMRTCVAALAGWGFGLWAEREGYPLLFVVYACCCLAMSACVLSMAPVHLRASTRILWFDAFRHVGADRAFRKLLVVWMVLGIGNLVTAALFVEYIVNPRYGFALPADRSGLITSTIPMLAGMVTVLPWGWVFDRMPFYQVRALVNLFFVAGILTYYLGDNLITLGIGIAFYGIAGSGGDILWALWTSRFASGDRVAEYQSVHSFLTGVRGVAAPLAAFAVVESLGPTSVAWISAVLMLLATWMILPEVLGEFRSRRAKPQEG